MPASHRWRWKRCCFRDFQLTQQVLPALSAGKSRLRKLVNRSPHGSHWLETFESYLEKNHVTKPPRSWNTSQHTTLGKDLRNHSHCFSPGGCYHAPHWH